MINNGLTTFKGRRVLLLQGPVGPFFSRLSCDLKHAGVEVVFKINFNGGDFFFYPKGSVQYRDKPENWLAFFRTFVLEHDIDLIFLFGDCRPIHKVACQIAQELEVEVGVFEEGYIRPDYITLERDGVNGNSNLPKSADFYKLHASDQLPEPKKIKNTYWYMVVWAIIYYMSATVLKLFFLKYEHHRPLSVLESWPWLKSIWRKQYYLRKEKDIESTLVTKFAKRFFLVPLQVHNDSQIMEHSAFDSVEDFICKTIQSFGEHAPQDTVLVIKHHPMDRGYHDYTKLIERVVGEDLRGRVLYIRDQHLPSLLRVALGVVVVNSTVGLSAIRKHVPVFVEGDCIYKVSEMVYMGELKDFWQHASLFAPNVDVVSGYLKHLITTTQLNGSFYRGRVSYS